MRIARVVWLLSAVPLLLLTVGPVFAQDPSGGPGAAAPQTGGTPRQTPGAPQSTEPDARETAPAAPTGAAQETSSVPPGRQATARGGFRSAPILRPPARRDRRSAQGLPLPPTAYGTASQYLSSDAGAAAGTVATIGIGPSRWPSVLSTKPFANFTPSSPISPYMNLFRTDTTFGTIDNYNSRVRPLLAQQRVNQQTGNRIRSLQLQSRTRGTQIRQLGQQTQLLQGTARPPAFMDYGGYYPSLGQ